MVVNEAQGLGIETERGAPFVHRLDPPEQARVEDDGVLVSRQPGRDGLLQRLQRRVGVRRGEPVEDHAHGREGLAALLQLDEGVLERRRRRAPGNRANLLQVARHPRLERGREILVCDQVEARCAERQRTRGQQRIGAGHERIIAASRWPGNGVS